MAILIDSGTPATDKNFWGTTWECFADAQALYGRPFEIDVCAEPTTAKVNRYLMSAEWLDKFHDYRHNARLLEQLRAAGIGGSTCVGFDALNFKWDEHWYCNPPFDLKVDFIQYGQEQRDDGRPGMMLLPYEPLTQWWQDNLSEGCIIYEPDGRYQFYERDGKTKKNNANFGSALVVFPTFKIEESPRIRFNRGIAKTIKTKELS